MSNTSSNNFLERFQKYKNELIRATTNSILDSTIQFFYDNAKGEPAPTGSGLLISIADRFFMLTAAHVIAEDYNSIFIILPDKELTLGGKLHFTPLPLSGKREDDKIDIAIMELEDSVVSDILSSFKFITLDNIEIGHKVDELPYYLSVGYPATKTKKVWKQDEISAIPYPYQTEPEPKFEFEKFGFNKFSHIAVKFDGKVTSESNKSVHSAPKMNGISGSGLWYLKDFATPNMIDNKQLVGLVIERVNTSGNQAIIATRIDLVTEFLRQHFNLDVPKSTTVKVNLK
ncbi:serine protease [Flavobacterium sp. HXWNR69]|uniref:Serine protease n=1 Tax=Flavobacterium fragile TaxID=2949085 RepID=A0ABT0TGU4_9FLAO|nr:serine protease [Flavobacterium sp. HXWNR69]MCL9770196.1 serine protease [Flavobacterium sp. HXWNR69]